MSILEDLTSLLARKGIPVETGIFSDEAPEAYIVIVPLADTFDLHADNAPGVDTGSSAVPVFQRQLYEHQEPARPAAPAGGLHDHRQAVQRLRDGHRLPPLYRGRSQKL